MPCLQIWKAPRRLQQQQRQGHNVVAAVQGTLHSPQKRMMAWLVPSVQWPLGTVAFSRVVGQPQSAWL